MIAGDNGNIFRLVTAAGAFAAVPATTRRSAAREPRHRPRIVVRARASCSTTRRAAPTTARRCARPTSARPTRSTASPATTQSTACGRRRAVRRRPGRRPDRRLGQRLDLRRHRRRRRPRRRRPHLHQPQRHRASRSTASRRPTGAGSTIDLDAGQRQQVATINVDRPAQEDRRPDAVQPRPGDRQPEPARSAPQYADDIIYGGLGDDFLHGGAGDDAISGAEALPSRTSGATRRSRSSDRAAATSTPVQPGQRAPLQRRTSVTSTRRAGRRVRALRRVRRRCTKIVLDASEFFRQLRRRPTAPLRGRAAHGLRARTPHSDGNDTIFGDLGNDWIVGGTGRDQCSAAGATT